MWSEDSRGERLEKGLDTLGEIRGKLSWVQLGTIVAQGVDQSVVIECLEPANGSLREPNQCSCCVRHPGVATGKNTRVVLTVSVEGSVTHETP